MRGHLDSKWDSVVVVHHVVILEAGHCTIISTTETFFFLFSDVDVYALMDVGMGSKRKRSSDLDER